MRFKPYGRHIYSHYSYEKRKLLARISNSIRELQILNPIENEGGRYRPRILFSVFQLINKHFTANI